MVNRAVCRFAATCSVLQPYWDAKLAAEGGGLAAGGARWLEPLLSGAESGGLAAMARIAEERARLGAPSLCGLPVADAHEVAVRSRRGLIDAADAGRQAAAFGGAWH